MIETYTLTDGGQTAADVAQRVAAFVGQATRTLEVALYDLRLLPPTAKIVVDAFQAAIARGVRVRMAYNVDHRRPIAVPPPPETDPHLIASTGADANPVYGIPDLMHHKYVVRDGTTVWTGSTNWTEDSWTREENVIVELESAELASWYTRNFEELWTTGSVGATGKFTPKPVTIGEASVRALFCPGRGSRLAHRIAGAIGRADRRVRVASPVITSGTILGTLAEVAASGRVDVAGVYDATQMQEVFDQWRAEEHAVWKIPCFTGMVTRAPFGAKVTTPYRPGSVHDYMHAKVCVVDDVTFVGSYNLSHSGEENAENVLEIKDAGVADKMAAFIDEIRQRYPSSGPPR